MAKSVWAPLYEPANFKNREQTSFLDRLRKRLDMGCAHCGDSRVAFACTACNRKTCEFCTSAYTDLVKGYMPKDLQSHPSLTDLKKRFCQPCTYAGFLEAQQVWGIEKFLERKLPTAKRMQG